MLKPYTRYTRLAVIVVPLLIVVLLLVSSTPTLASVPSAPVNIFDCAPVTVAVFTNRVHVSCNPLAPGNIAYFAYCSTTDSATASRFLSTFTAAKALGKNINIYYNPNDTSGTTCGCLSGNCRVLTGAEIQP